MKKLFNHIAVIFLIIASSSLVIAQQNIKETTIYKDFVKGVPNLTDAQLSQIEVLLTKFDKRWNQIKKESDGNIKVDIEKVKEMNSSLGDELKNFLSAEQINQVITVFGKYNPVLELERELAVRKTLDKIDIVVSLTDKQKEDIKPILLKYAEMKDAANIRLKSDKSQADKVEKELVEIQTKLQKEVAALLTKEQIAKWEASQPQDRK